MKKMIFMLILIFLCGCSAIEPTSVLRIYLPENYINSAVLEQFEAQTGVRVLCDTFSTNEEMFAKISKEKDEYDIVIAQDYMMERMLEEEFAEGEPVPYMTGVLGILYNKDLAEEPSWDSLWDEEYAGQIIMPSSRFDCFSAALLALGFPPDSVDPAEIEEATQKLIAQRRIVEGYYGGGTGDRMVSERAALALVYSHEAWYAMERAENLAFVVPGETSRVFTNYFVILKDTKSAETAQQFIDFTQEESMTQLNQSVLGDNFYPYDSFSALANNAERRALIDYAWSWVMAE